MMLFDAGRHPFQVSEEDVDTVRAGRWAVHKQRRNYYVVGRPAGQRRKVYLARWLLKAPDHLQVDHVNGDGRDNRRENLRLATNRMNQRNRHRWSGASGFKGVRRHGTRWQARIRLDGQYLSLGTYSTRAEAAAAYDGAAYVAFGEYAWPNQSGQCRMRP